jgi:ribosome-associated protein
MAKKSDPVSAEILSKYIIKGIQEKKGTNIVLLDLRPIGNAVTDFFVICTGSSDTQVDAISDSVEKEASEGANEKPWHKEGTKNKEWILLDYVNIVVHIFRKEAREFYGLEELWGDAPVINVENS